VSADPRPSSWLLLNEDLLPRAGYALDVACGRGRHALFLAQRGLTVVAVDRDPQAIDELSDEAFRRGLALQARVVDLEAGEVDLGRQAYDLIVVVHYLYPPLFPTLVRAMAPGALLLYETFTVDHARQGKPTNPDFLLRHGELAERLGSLEILRQRDGAFEGRQVAAIAARKA
jgi:SAM-dependent methyltransferase